LRNGLKCHPGFRHYLDGKSIYPCISIPAEYGSIKSLFKNRAHPSAIWLRQELPVQRNNILIFAL